MRSVATPEDTAGSQVAFHVFTSSIPVTPWALVKRENLRHWSHPFGRVIPWGAATASRIAVRDHTPTQVFVGSCIGVIEAGLWTYMVRRLQVKYNKDLGK